MLVPTLEGKSKPSVFRCLMVGKFIQAELEWWVIVKMIMNGMGICMMCVVLNEVKKWVI